MKDHASEGIRIIDEFFETEAVMSEEDKLLEGLNYGVEHGFLTSDERDACLKAYVEARNQAVQSKEPS